MTLPTSCPGLGLRLRGSVGPARQHELAVLAHQLGFEMMWLVADVDPADAARLRAVGPRVGVTLDGLARAFRDRAERLRDAVPDVLLDLAEGDSACRVVITAGEPSALAVAARSRGKLVEAARTVRAITTSMPIIGFLPAVVGRTRRRGCSAPWTRWVGSWANCAVLG